MTIGFEGMAALVDRKGVRVERPIGLAFSEARIVGLEWCADGALGWDGRSDGEEGELGSW